MMVFAIDPGTTRSAWVVYDSSTSAICSFATTGNADLLATLRHTSTSIGVDRVVIEKVESFGMAVGAEVFETVFWSGQFAEAVYPVPVHRIGRKAVKIALCGTTKAKDSNIRQALIDRYGGSSAIGRKASPGPLYGISGDEWAALAVAVAHTEGI